MKTFIKLSIAFFLAIGSLIPATLPSLASDSNIIGEPKTEESRDSLNIGDLACIDANGLGEVCGVVYSGNANAICVKAYDRSLGVACHAIEPNVRLHWVESTPLGDAMSRYEAIRDYVRAQKAFERLQRAMEKHDSKKSK